MRSDNAAHEANATHKRSAQATSGRSATAAYAIENGAARAVTYPLPFLAFLLEPAPQSQALSSAFDAIHVKNKGRTGARFAGVN